MAITTAAGIAFDTVTTDQQAPLGFELVVPTADQGEKVWIYVQASAAGVNPGIACMRSAGVSTYTVLPTTVLVDPVLPARIVGVAQHAIANASYGFILKRGIAIVQAGNGTVLTADRGLTAAGTVIAGTLAIAISNTNAVLNTQDKVFGWCVTASVATGPAPNGLDGRAMIDCNG